MKSMFSTAEEFNQPLNAWNVSHVTIMKNMFLEAAFNQSLSNWKTTMSAEELRGMFNGSPCELTHGYRFIAKHRRMTKNE